MKLSTKISAAAAGLLLLLSQVFSLWNLTVSRRELLNAIVVNEAEQLERDLRNLNTAFQRDSSYLTNERGVRFWAAQTFRRNYSERSVLYYQGEELFNNILYGMLLALALTLVLAAALTLIIRRILVPFYRLRDAANRIASGDYGRRVENPGRDEVGEVAQSFNCMAENVERHVRELAGINEKQQQLLGALAHELKTPMTGIQGYAELLQKVELSPEKQADALAYIRDECRRLSRLSVKMLQLTELSQEKRIEKRRLSVEKLCSRAEEIARCRLLEKQIRLEIQAEDGLQMEGDEDLLLSFLTNLLDNAAKASRPGGTIWMSGTSEGLFVRDEGEGIPEKERGHVAEPFYMVDKSRSRAQGGAGLGLALCAQIARLHGGTLQIESTPGQGSTVGLAWEQPRGDASREESAAGHA